MRRFTIIIMQLLLCTFELCAQNVVLFNSKQRLSNSCISRIYEDSRHNIWIATKNGLNRSDGVKMNIYRHDESNPYSISHDTPTSMLEYDKNHILIGTGDGLNVYEYSTNRFHFIPFVGIDGDTVKINVIDICRIKDKGKERILMTISGYGNGEILTDGKGNFSIKHIAEFNSDPNCSPNQILQDHKNRTWIINNRDNLYLRQNKKFKQYPEIEGAVKIIVSCDNRVYVATTQKGLFVYDEKADQFKLAAEPSIFGGVICNINPWKDSRLMICTDGGGLRVFDGKDNSVTLSTLKINDFNLSTANVKDAIFDKAGNLWIGIYMRGLMMKPNSKSAFEYIGRLSITKNSIGTSSVFAIGKAIDNKHIWVAPDNDGLYYMTADGTSSIHYSKENGSNCPAAFTCIHALPSTTLLGTFLDGLWQLDNGSFSLITKSINKIFDIQPADNGNLWIATIGQGIYYYNPTTHEYKQFTADFSKGEAGTRIICNPYDYCVLQLGKQLFVGSADGLSVCKYGGNGTFTGKSDHLFRTISINHICASADKKSVWVGTDEGLYLIDCKTLKYKRYSTANGLPNNNVEALTLDGNNLWVATDNGLSCFDTKNESFHNFYSDDGLQDDEFNRGTIVTLNNNIYFGGIGGICYFSPAKIASQKVSSNNLRVKFVDLFIGGKSLHKGDLSGSYEIMQDVLDDCGKFEVCNRDNHFILELCVDGYYNKHFTYEYSIDGGDWTNQGEGSNRLIFDNLKAGTYKIRIRAVSFNSVSEERELIVVVHPAWYASWWAKLIYIIILALLAYAAYLYAQRQITARKLILRHRQEQQINEARIQFFMNISHEIRTPMTLILAPLDKLLRMDKDPECQRSYSIMKQNANRILRLINQMMDVRKIEQGKYQLDYHKTEIVSLLQNAFDVFNGQAENRHINYQFIHKDIDNLIAYVDPENIDKIVMNLLSNAFKFTPDNGSISMELLSGQKSVITEDGVTFQPSFILHIMDTGTGIKDEDKPKIFERFYSGAHKNGHIGTGIGLNLSSLLVTLHNGEIKVMDNPSGKGTLFTIELPIGDESMQTFKGVENFNINEKENQNDNVINKDDDNEEAAPLITVNENLNDSDKESSNEVEAEEIDNKVAEDVVAANENSITEESSQNEQSFANQELDNTYQADKVVVLVEDDAAIREYVHAELSTELTVTDFSNGQEAWDYVIAHPQSISLVISDIMMPVMDGLTLCQKVKSNFNTNHIPILLMTALGSDADRIVGITNGADAYIPKPFNIDVLRTTVIGLLKNRQLLQGRFKSEKLKEENIEQIEVESPDENLMRRIMKVINENMDNDDLSVEMIADKVGISRVHFYRKMKDLTGQGPREFVKYVRLKEAARLLSTKKMDITGVSIATGFKSPSAFSTSFKGLFGLTPTEWMKKEMKKEE